MKQLALFQGLLPEFISQLWRKIYGCKMKFGIRPGKKLKAIEQCYQGYMFIVL